LKSRVDKRSASTTGLPDFLVFYNRSSGAKDQGRAQKPVSMVNIHKS